MAVVLEFRSRAANVLRDQKKVIDQSKEMAKGYRESSKEAGNLERTAKRLSKQLETPQEKHNRKLKELSRLLKSGRIDQEQMRRAVEMYNQELREAQMAGKRAFGSSALADLRSMATGFVGVGAAIGGAIAQLRQFVQERDQAAQQVQAGRRGLAQLSQLADTPEQMRTLLSEARGIFAAGGTTELGEAGGVLFSLISAGVGRQEREMFRDLTARGVIADPAASARSARALQSAMGTGETGGFRDILSKSFAASAASPATTGEILQGAASAGPGARTLGVRDEEVLAATAVLAEPTGSASEAGTKLRALFKNVERGGVEGRSLDEIVSNIGKRIESGEQFEDVFGGRRDQEAIDAFRLLRLNAETLRQVTGEVDTAVKRDLVSQKLALPDVDPQLRVARLAEQARQRGQVVSQEELGSAANLIEALSQERFSRARKEGGGGVLTELGIAVEKLQLFSERMLGDRNALSLFDPADVADPQLRKVLEEFNALQSQQLNELRGIRENQSAKPPVTRTQGRQE